MKGHKRTLKRVTIRLFVALLLFCVISYLAVIIVFANVFARPELRQYSYYLRFADVADECERQPVSFLSGENRLQGYLMGPENGKGLVVISHGIGSCADGYLPEEKYFADQGFRVFCYDNTGCGSSEGENMVGLCQAVLDLDAALDYAEQDQTLSQLPFLLYGHSLGGYAVTAILNYDHPIAATVSVAGFNHPMEVIMDWGREWTGPLAYAGYPFLTLYQHQLFGKQAELNAVDGINRSDIPVMLIHGSGDTNVDYDSSATVSHRDQIINPNVTYVIREDEGRNDHTHLMRSEAAVTYENQLRQQAVEDEETFYSGIDKTRTSELDAELMQQIVDFYIAAITQS